MLQHLDLSTTDNDKVHIRYVNVRVIFRQRRFIRLLYHLWRTPRIIIFGDRSSVRWSICITGSGFNFSAGWYWNRLHSKKKTSSSQYTRFAMRSSLELSSSRTELTMGRMNLVVYPNRVVLVLLVNFKQTCTYGYGLLNITRNFQHIHIRTARASCFWMIVRNKNQC